MKSETNRDVFDEESKLEKLGHLQQLALCLIQFSEQEKEGLGTSDIDWLGRYAKRITNVVRDLRGLDPEEPQAGDKTQCVAITGGYGESIAGHLRNIPVSEPEGPLVVIPLEMSWTQALARLDYIVAELRGAIYDRTDSKVGALNLEDLPF